MRLGPRWNKHIIDPVRALAHWTITQRTIHIVLANKPPVLSHEKTILTGSVGDIIRAVRRHTGLTQEKLAELAGIQRHWLA